MPHFPLTVEAVLANSKTGQTYRLVRGDQIAPLPINIEDIKSICNEPQVYRWLFDERLGSKPYTSKMAGEYLAWAKVGWTKQTHFVFFVLSEFGRIVAAVDIKSPDTANGEIGYWASAAHGGIMTPAVAAVVEIASTAGYYGLFADVGIGNDGSEAVMTKNGFDVTGESPSKRSFHRELS